MPSIAIVAGDPSGDLYGAAIADALRRLVPDLCVWGAGGPRMKATRVELAADLSLASAIGIAESSKVVPSLLVSYLRLRSLVARRRPDALVVIDFGAFNRRLAEFARRKGIRTVYFIPPGSWRRTTRSSAATARCADLFLTPFPWSAENLRKVGAVAEYVGHPLLDLAVSTADRHRFLEEVGLDAGGRCVALLPGSRRPEITHILPALLNAADLIVDRMGDVQFVIAAAPAVYEQVLRRLDRRRNGAKVVTVANRTYDTLASADLALVASGTATLEAAVLGCPMVVVYRGSAPATLEKLLRGRILEKYIGLPNIIAGEGICPELVAREATGERIAAEALRLLDNASSLEEVKWNLSKVKLQLGQPGAVQRSANLIARLAGLTVQ